MEVWLYYTTVASDIARDMFVAWLDGWGVPYCFDVPEDVKGVLVERGVLKWDGFTSSYKAGDRYSAGTIAFEGGDYIVCVFADEADVVRFVTIKAKHDVAKYICEKFRRVEDALNL